MTPGGKPGAKRGRVLALIVALAAFAVYLVVGSVRTVQTECELCVTFQGQTECRRGSGADAAEARQAAQKAACAVMAHGMNETIACGNVVPTNVQCPSR
ncbi:MAG: hypothetical protein JSW43_02665 [Gemmatimonadota bacterium]|nr:MAG: hypothetical protein JSW43_02665 [Gemmatimonadota bacterium]